MALQVKLIKKILRLCGQIWDIQLYFTTTFLKLKLGVNHCFLFVVSGV